ncbi:MAG: SAM-dependent chlorinase/fluorinase [Candidatus Hinthialibacter antarcticus]|nr:SAM-dependent chlorinase/fluorinase [Candidatus Hinthialibacter antarcticus]
MMNKRPIVTLLTDFGNADGFIGVMKGVMLQIAPDIHFVDITHELPAFSLSAAAFLNSWSYGYFPPGTVHLCVVDPGVGTQRRALIVETQGHTFIAPDNGLLSPVLSLTGERTIISATDPKYWLSKVSYTFHGRDIFSPLAAHIARGVSISVLGPQINDPVMLPCDPPSITPNCIECHIRYIDHFGNLITDLTRSRFDHWAAQNGCEFGSVEIHLDGVVINGVSKTYGVHKPGALAAVFDGYDCLEIAVTQGNASQQLGLSVDRAVTVKPATTSMGVWNS